MLSTIQTRDVSAYGTQATNSFSIKANGKAFKVLIDGLYSDKVRAVVRELWTNALDSHVMAGKADVPFDCHLPTYSDMVFTVRDYGVSLSDDGVMRLYTTVFESSKEDTNTQVGKLGLGSKSPFAYTDTFTVTAWLHGRKRTYSAYIGADYVPQIARMSDEASDEPQGLSISFPVSYNDRGLFTNAAREVARGFDVIPTMTGATFSPHAETTLLSGDGWKLLDTSSYMSAEARQGCVLYPLDSAAVRGLTPTQIDMLGTALIIDFPIGQLEISANREALGYDAPTCANICARMATIEKEINAYYTAELASAKTYWEFVILRQKLRSSHMPRVAREIAGRATFRGWGASKENHISISLKAIRNIPSTGLDRNKLGCGTAPKLNDVKARHLYITPGAVLVYVQDPTVPAPYAGARIATHYAGVQARPAQVLYIRCTKNSATFKRLYVAMGRPPMSVFVWVNELPKHVPMRSANRTQAAVKEVRRLSLSDVTIDVNAGGYYLPIAHNKFLNLVDAAAADQPTREIDTMPHSSAWQMICALKKMTLLPVSATVYAVPQTLKSMTEDPGWVSVWDVVRQALATFDATKARMWAAAHRAKTQNRLDVGLLRKFAAEGVKFADDNGVAATVVRDFTTMQALPDDAAVYSAYHALVLTVLSPTHSAAVAFQSAHTDNLTDLVGRFGDAYPMLRLLTSTTNYQLFDTPSALTIHAIAYVNLVDAAVASATVREAD